MAINEYELVLVTRPELTEDVVQHIKTSITGFISEQNGQVLVFDSWGQRKLAYPIQKSKYGNYYLVDFVAEGETPALLERHIKLRLSNIIRFLTVKLDDDIKDFGSEELMEARKEAAVKRSQKTIERLNAALISN
ncbi:MAG: 30S ribosomal protein S6 [Myxococcota bacterium]|nr:30S ribosomal protein S6 [Myxococcota bacterium]